MAVDLKKTWFSHTDVCPLTVGATVSEEGCGLVAVLEDGIEKVRCPVLPADAAAKVAGFGVFRQKDFTVRPIVQSVVVPTAMPYTVQLDHQNIVPGQIRCYDETAAAPVIPVVDPVHGVLTFLVGAAGHTVTVTYKYNMTMAEAKMLYQEAPTNYPDPNYFSTVGVGKGKGRVFTTFFDAAVDFSAATAIKLATGGMITDQTGAGPEVVGARVVQLPTATDPVLGLEFVL